jgi:hypothetical protein
MPCACAQGPTTCFRGPGRTLHDRSEDPPYPWWPRLTDEDLEALATEVAGKDCEVDVLKTRRSGRPPMGSGPADVVPMRIDPELRAAIEARAEDDHATTSEIFREAIRRFIDVV